MSLFSAQASLRRIRRALAGPFRFDPSGIFRRQTRSFHLALPLVRALYAVSILLLMDRYRWFLQPSSALVETPWLAFWFAYFPPGALSKIVLSGAAISFLAAAIWPGSRAARTFAFMGAFYFAALALAFGSIIYNMYLWIYLLFAMIFLPSLESWREPERCSRRSRQMFLLVIWFALSIFAMTYFCSAFWKVALGIAKGAQLGNGSLLDISALSRQVAIFSLRNWIEPPFADAIVRAPFLGWLMMVATIYFQATSPLVLFRPTLYFPWGIYFLTFHVAGIAILDSPFRMHAFFAAVFFLGSPFAAPYRGWGETLSHFPGAALARTAVARLAKRDPRR